MLFLARKTRQKRAHMNDDQMLVARLMQGDREATNIFLQKFKDTIWKFCRVVADNKSEAERIFPEVYRAIKRDNFQRLSAYDGKGEFETLVKLAAREILKEMVIRLVSADDELGWSLFLYFYLGSIDRWIAHRLKSPDDRNEASLFVLNALPYDNSKTIKAYSGKAEDGKPSKFESFLRSVVDNLITDFHRTRHGRQRPPSAVAQLSPLDQFIYAEVRWEGVPEDASIILSRFGESYALSMKSALFQDQIRKLQVHDIAAALARIRQALNGKPIGQEIRRLSSSDDVDPDTLPISNPDPEVNLIKTEQERLAKAAYDEFLYLISLLPEEELSEKEREAVDKLKNEHSSAERPSPGRPPTALFMQILQKALKRAGEDSLLILWASEVLKRKV
jgi:hypothetical protein